MIELDDLSDTFNKRSYVIESDSSEDNNKNDKEKSFETLFLEEFKNTMEKIQIDNTQEENNNNSNENKNDIILPSQIGNINNITKNKIMPLNKKVKFEVSHRIDSSTGINNNSTNSKTQNNNNKNKNAKKYLPNKKGRIKKEDKKIGIKGIHTKNNADNFKKKLFTHCSKNLHKIIKSYIKNNNYSIKIAGPTPTPQMKKKKNEEDLKTLSKKKIKDIYLASKPKKSSSNYAEKIRKAIESILQKEEEKQNENDKILKIILNKTLREFLLMYVKDYTYLNHFEDLEQNEIPLYEFITFESEFKDLEPKRKIKIKKKMLELLDYKENENKNS